MDLTAVILFLIMYYLRPQEWGSIFSTVHFVQLVMMMAIATLFFRERSLRLADLFKTPHDWAVFAFVIYTSLAAPDKLTVFKGMFPLAMFYVVIVQTLTTVPRMSKFISWWTFLIVGVAALAIASEYGFDPLGSYDITHGRMKDRLVLNLSIFDNPNGLGHSVGPSLAMLYFFCVWKRPVAFKQLGWTLMIIPAWCIFLTASKGSFLAASGTLMTTFTFGRPKAAQVAILAAGLIFGGAALYKLPRMTELNKAKSDAAIQGRVAAFTHGINVYRSHWFGLGRGHWMDSFYREHHYWKACHSSYVQTGAELGAPGFFLFFLILYTCLRTLMTIKTTDIEEERLRRTLFVLVISYMVSSWMVDFGFRPTLFMFTGAVAALHRHLLGLVNTPEPEAKPAAALVPAWRARFIPQAVLAGANGLPVAAMTMEAPAVASGMGTRGIGVRVGETVEEMKPFWNRITWVDLVIVFVMVKCAVRFWAYMISRM